MLLRRLARTVGRWVINDIKQNPSDWCLEDGLLEHRYAPLFYDMDEHQLYYQSILRVWLPLLTRWRLKRVVRKHVLQVIKDELDSYEDV